MSILKQTFGNFEVIVGNDYVQKKITPETLSIGDSRIRIVNYPQNLGEANNMNALLEMGCGRYFTWLADDDMYAPTFLQAVHTSLVKFDYPTCVFTSYMQGDTFPDRVESFEGEIRLFEGRQFLRQYLSRKLKTQGCYGLFDVKFLRQIGGIEQLGNGFSPYSDNLLAIRAGLLEKVVYIDAPLVFFRTHEESISLISPDVDAYSSAQRDLLPKSLEVFRSERLSDDFHFNLFLLLKWCLANYCTVMRRSGSLQSRKLIRYILFLMSYAKMLGRYRYRMMAIILRSTYKLVSQLMKISAKKKILRTS